MAWVLPPPSRPGAAAGVRSSAAVAGWEAAGQGLKESGWEGLECERVVAAAWAPGLRHGRLFDIIHLTGRYHRVQVIERIEVRQRPLFPA